MSPNTSMVEQQEHPNEQEMNNILDKTFHLSISNIDDL
jgi:hypothetical protein